MKKLIVYLSILLMFIYVGGLVFAQSNQRMAVESFTPLERDMSARIDEPKMNVDGDKKCAIIKVVTPNTGFTFSTGTYDVIATSQRTGEIWVWVQPGVKYFTIKHQQLGVLRDYAFPCEIKSACVYELRLTSGTVHTIVDQGPQSGYLIIKSEPSGANVFLLDNGEEEWVGTTPYRKQFQLGSTFQYRIKKNLYHDEVGIVGINSVKQEVSATLRPAFGSVSVTSTPAGATVFLDDEETPRGVTPLNIEKVASGDHKLTLRKEMYGQIIQPIQVIDNQVSNANITMQANFAKITVNTLPGASILVDGETKSAGSYTWNQEDGVCEVVTQLPGHRDAKRTLQVFAGQDQTIQLDPTPMYGMLNIDSDPIDAEIWIDGKQYGTTPNIVTNLLAAEHTITLKKAGCADYTTKVTVEEAKETALLGKLETGKTNNREFNVNGVKFTMIAVEGGTFTMGATDEQRGDAFDDEVPTHKVTLAGYLIGQTEVTQELWQAVMGSNPCEFKGNNLPVECVSWYDCQKFIEKLNSLTGEKFRLPTEAEWEFAARGGNKSKGYKYSGSNDIEMVAWHKGNSSDRTHQVAGKQPNELGIYDMTGNVWEWCSDWYGDYGSVSQTNPTGSETGTDRIYRGGSWLSKMEACRVSHRNSYFPASKSKILGLRLAY